MEFFDTELIRIERAARTVFSWLAPAHHHLRRRFSWYQRWHEHPHAHKIHWATLTLTLIVAVSSVLEAFIGAPVAYAADYTITTNSTWCDSADLPSSIGNLTIAEGVTVTLGGSTGSAVNGGNTGGTDGCSYEVGGWTLSGTGTLTVNGTLTLGSEISGSTGAGVPVSFATITNASTGSITASSQGFSGGSGSNQNGIGTGAGGGGGGSGGGGGYGGAGLAGGADCGGAGSAGATYGASTKINPTDLGSGGGGGWHGNGGAGGGLVRLTATGTFTNSGTVTANGGDGSQWGCGAGGGGSGGSVYVVAGTLAGSGGFFANGGTGGARDGLGGGAGAGGRIAVYYATDGGYTGFSSSRVIGGTGDTGTGNAGTAGFFDVTDTGTHTTDTTRVLTVYQTFDYAEDSTLTLGGITVAGGGTLTIDGGSTVTASGTITTTGASSALVLGSKSNTGASGGSGVTMTAANVSIGSGSSINANGQGYTAGSGVGVAGNGPGAGPAGGTRGSGGGYGGAGGGSSEAAGGAANGSSSAATPTELGSGGAGGYNSSAGGTAAGGAGGGLVRMTISGTLTVNGTLSANGTSVSTYAGAGSGGSVYVSTALLTGSGSITASGGAKTGDDVSGAGGGGRIAVYYSDASSTSSFTGFTSTSVAGGEGGSFDGSAGTAIFFDTSTGSSTPHIYTYNTYTYAADSTISASSISVLNGGTLTIGGGSSVSISSTLTVSGTNSTLLLQGKNTTSASGGDGVDITAATVTVGSGASISADGQGYTGGASGVAGNGPGGGGTAQYGGGGGHGGAGGRSSSASNGGTTYGTASAPTDLGSGGGGGESSGTGGTGGGGMQLTISGTLTNNGTLTADGATGAANGGGGAGGSIYVSTGVISGSGTFTATGANGNSTANAGAGGGGRIAIFYDSRSSDTTTRTVAGGDGFVDGTTGSNLFASKPSASLTSPSDGGVGGATPTLTISVDDYDDRTLYARIQYIVLSAANCSAQSFASATTADSSTSTTGWSGTGQYSTSSGAATATFTVQSSLTNGSTYCWRAGSKATSGDYTDWGSYTSALSFIVDTVAPTTATVTSPTATYYSSSTVPSSFTGSAADDSSGQGLTANTTTFTLQRGSDSGYWTGSAWGASTNLATTHSATSGSTAATWTDAIDLPSWSDGTYTTRATATDKGSNSTTGSAVSFTYDATAPTTPATVYDGTDTTDDSYTTSTTQLVVNWTASTDATSGVANYQYAVGTTSGGTQTVSWTSTGSTSTSLTISSLTLSSGSTYYVSIRAVDNSGNTGSGTSANGIVVDSTNPTAPATVYDGTDTTDDDYTTSTTTLYANWTASTDTGGSGVARYEYAVGTSSGGTQTVSWTSTASTDTSLTISSLTLSNGSTYYVSIRAVDNAGNTGSGTSADGILVDTTNPSAPTTVYDGTDSTDDAYTTSTTTLYANWTASTDTGGSGVAQYQYAVGTTSGGTQTVSWTSTSSTSTSLTISSLTLTGGSTYYVSIRAVDNAGNTGSGTSSDGVTVDATNPSTPATVYDGTDTTDDAYTTSTSTLYANWTASTDTGGSGVARYEYAVGTSSGGTQTVSWTSTGSTSTSLTISSLTLSNGSTYYVSVRAVDSAGNTGSGTSSDGVTVDATNPSTPATVYDGSDSTDDTVTSSTTQLLTNWTASTDTGGSGVAQYQYAVGTSSGGTQTVSWTSTSSTSTSLTISSLTLTGGSTYYVSIRAVDNAGNTGSSTSSDGVTVDATNPTAPATVYDGTDTTDDDYTTSTTQLLANWTASTDTGGSGVARYEYAVGTSSGGTQTVSWTSTGSTSTSLTISSLTLSNGSTYYVSVRAVDNAGNTGSGTSSDGIFVDTTNPSTPTTVYDGTDTTDDAYTTSTTTLYANWTASTDTGGSGVAQYQYAVGTSSGGTQTVSWTSTSSTSTSLTISSLTLSNGSTYYVSIRAVDNAGNTGSGTSADGILVDTTNPSTPTTVYDGTDTTDDAYTTSTTTLYANWTASTDTGGSGVAQYQYAVGTSSGGTQTVSWTSTSSTSTSLTISSLTLSNGSTYYVSIRAVDNAGNTGSGTSSDGVTVDATNPSTPATVYDGTDSTDDDYTISTTTLYANWTASTDGGSGIVQYQYAVGTTSGGTETVSWTSTDSTSTSATIGSLTLTGGTTYYISVRAVDNAGNTGSATSSSGALVDATAPTTPTTVYDGADTTDDNYTTSTTTLYANWTASTDTQSGVATYQYAVGTSSGGTQTVSWTSTSSTSTSLTISSLTLSNGSTYYVSIRAVDNAGNTGGGRPSDGITVDATAPVTASVTTPSESSVYRSSTVPSNFIGSVADDGSGGGLAADSTTLRILRVSDGQYWTGTAFSSSATNLTTTHSATSSGSSATWTSSSSLPSWSDGTWRTQAQATDQAGSSIAGSVVSFTYDATAPSTVGSISLVVDGTSGSGQRWINSTSQLAASWNAASDTTSGVASYQYAIGTTSGGTNVRDWTSVSGTNVTATGLSLSAGSSYYLSVRAVDSAGNAGSLSTSSNVVVDTAPPSAISNLTATANNDGTVTLTWTSPGDDGGTGTASSFDIRYATSPITEASFSNAASASLTPTPSGAGTQQSLILSGLTAGVGYSFAIRTTDELGRVSAISNVLVDVVAANPASSANPTIKNPTPSTPAQSTVTVTVGSVPQTATSGAAIHVPPGESIELAVSTDPTKAVDRVIVTIGDSVVTLTDSDGDGIFEGSVRSPLTAGSTAGSALVTYLDGTSQVTSVSLLVDPFGYLFVITDDGQQRLSDAQVALYAIIDGQPVLWDGTAYGQTNPQVTGPDGSFSFFVPAGTYQIIVTVDGEVVYRSPDQVVTTQPISLVIDLTSQLGPIPLPAIPAALVSALRTLGPVGRALSSFVATTTRALVPIANATATQNATVVVTTATTVAAVTSFAVPLVANAPLLNPLGQLVAWLLSLAGRRRKPGQFGTVIDTESGQPVAGALIRILTADEGKLLDTQTTDANGQFSLVLGPGLYQLQPTKTHYRFPSRIESNGYHGAVLQITSEQTVPLTIPIDPEISTLIHRFHLLATVERTASVSRIPFMVTGSVLAAGYVFLQPTGLHIASATLYAFLWGYEVVSRRIQRPAHGQIIDGTTHAGLDLAIVRVADDTSHHLVASKVSDGRGSFLLRLPTGRYQTTVTRAGYQRLQGQPWQTSATSAVVAETFALTSATAVSPAGVEPAATATNPVAQPPIVTPVTLPATPAMDWKPVPTLTPVPNEGVLIQRGPAFYQA